MKKYLLIVPGVALMLAVIAHFVWTYSGSGEPELRIDRDGIRIYLIKDSGSALTRIRAVRRVDTTLERAVAAMLDGSLDNCIDWSSLCVASDVVEPWDPVKQYYIQRWQKNFPSPIGPREFVLKTQFLSDPETGAASVAFSAAPDTLPANDCCFRVSHMNSVWRFTPVAPGQVEVELSQDIDLGLPYILFNDKAPEAVFAVFEDLPRLYGKAKYDHVTMDSLLKAGAVEPAAAVSDDAGDAVVAPTT